MIAIFAPRGAIKIFFSIFVLHLDLKKTKKMSKYSLRPKKMLPIPPADVSLLAHDTSTDSDTEYCSKNKPSTESSDSLSFVYISKTTVITFFSWVCFTKITFYTTFSFKLFKKTFIPTSVTEQSYLNP